MSLPGQSTALLTVDFVSGLLQGAPGLSLFSLEAFDLVTQLAVTLLEGGSLVLGLLQLSLGVGQRATGALSTRLRCSGQPGLTSRWGISIAGRWVRNKMVTRN